jgi:tetratricopeptide (TPR) repeat protein
MRAHARPERVLRVFTFSYDGRTLIAADVQQLLGLTDDEARRGDVSRLANRGALLHTDIATTLDNLDPVAHSAASTGKPNAVLVLDGRQQGVTDRGPHWRLVRSLLDLIPADSPRIDSRRQWYVAAAAYMQSRSLMADLVPHLNKARQLFPADADILFYSGALNETMAAPFIQQAVRGISLPPGTELDVTDARTHLQAARTFFRRALERSPDRVEAHVRLGRVLGALGRHREAVDELQRALAGPASPLMRYYAALFLGGEQATLGRPDAARVSFDLASALYPRAQSPRLGLSSLARTAGRQADAAEVLLAALAPGRDDDPSRDPWWTYFAARRPEANELLDRWRRTVAGDAR